MICARHSNKFYLCGRLGRHSFRAADVTSTSPKYELGKVAFSNMFLKHKRSQRFWASKTKELRKRSNSTGKNRCSAKEPWASQKEFWDGGFFSNGSFEKKTDAGSRTNFWTTFHTRNRAVSFRKRLDLQILLRS